MILVKLSPCTRWKLIVFILQVDTTTGGIIVGFICTVVLIAAIVALVAIVSAIGTLGSAAAAVAAFFAMLSMTMLPATA